MKKYLPLLCAATSSALFSFVYFFTLKAAGAIGGSALKLLSFRMITASVVMTLLWKVFKVPMFQMDFKDKPIKWLVIAGLFSPVLSFVVESYGVQYVPSSMFAAMYATTPLIATLLSVFMLKEIPTKIQLRCMFIAFIGVLILNIVPGMTFSPLNILLPFIAMSAGVLGQIMIKRSAIAGFTSIECVYFTMSFSGVVYTLLAILEQLLTGDIHQYFDGVFTFDFIISILYLGIGCSIIAFSLYYNNLTKLPMVVTTSFSALSTVMSIIVGVVLLHEQFGLQRSIGVALILIGVMLMNLSYMRSIEEKLD